MVFKDVQDLVTFATTSKLKEWQTRLFKQYADEIQVHSKGQLFYKIDTLFPNEHPDSKKARLLSFEPITKASYNKGVSNIYRIFNNSSYTADLSDNTAQYITQNQFDNKNLFAYFLELWVDTALRSDANSLIVVYPEKFMQNKSFQRVTAVDSCDVVFYDDDTFIFKSEVESDVDYSLNAVQFNTDMFYDVSIDAGNMISTAHNTYNQKLVKTYKRTVYHAFVQNKFYQIVQNKDSQTQFTVTEFDLGANKLPPVTKAGGIKASKDIYEGFLSSFVHFGNLALLQHSQHTAVNFTFSFPRMSELQPVCDYQLCKNGLVSCPISDQYPDGQMPCPSCQGSGYKSVQSPYKIYIKRYDPSGLDETSTKDYLNADDVKYYTPPTSVLEYSKNEWKDYLKMAETSIFIQQKVYTGQVQSAESKDMDLDELYAFLISIAKVFYDKLRFVLQCFENYINARPMIVSVNIPYSFAILTEEEAFNSLNTIISSDAPALIKGNQVDTFISKFVSETSPIKKAYEVLKIVDLLFLLNNDEISLLKSNNVVSAEQWAAHTFAYPVLMQMFETDKKLFLTDVGVLAEKLRTELVKYKPAASDLKTVLVNRFTPQLNDTVTA